MGNRWSSRGLAERAGTRRLSATRLVSTPPSFYVAPVGDAAGVATELCVDILHAAPRPWGDLAGAQQLVQFAFEGGDCAGLFDAICEATPVADSGFDGASVTKQLHLEELIRAAFPIRIAGQEYRPYQPLLMRILSRPPRDVADTQARQAVLEELVRRPELRADLERAYLAVHGLRRSLDAAEEATPLRRKVAVLVQIRELVGALAEGFEGAASRLAELRSLGGRIRASEAFERLERFVDHDGNLASVDVRLQLGADGTLRDFQVLALRENHGNPYREPPWRRLLRRIAAFVRGHRYGEDEVSVRLLHALFAPLVQPVVECLTLTGAFELYLGSLGFCDAARAHGLQVCLPTFAPAGGAGRARGCRGLFNPLLFLQGVAPKPCDLSFPAATGTVVITGPNSGGKTRLLQSLAIAQCLGQVGVYVPAAEAGLVWAPKLYASLVLDVDAAQPEGRLGTELLRIRDLFSELEPGSVAVLDELCSGTNPMEGEALFEMVVSLLHGLDCQVFVSTHFLGLAARLAEAEAHAHAGAARGIMFLETELDADERPTFRFVEGVAKTSLAHRVAERLGVTRQALEALVAAKQAGHPRAK